MNTNPLDPLSSYSEGLTYKVLLETKPNGQVSATLWGLPECKAIGKNREEAINNITQLISDRINNSELISVNIMKDKSKNTWLEFAGMYKNNPVFDEVVSYMNSERSKMDEAIE